MNDTLGILIASESSISIRSLSDVSDAIGACLGSAGLILTEKDLGPDFFDLRTGLAGELFQKFVNYRIPVAIVVADPQVYGRRFSELACEHRNHNMIRFVRSTGEAQAWFVDIAS